MFEVDTKKVGIKDEVKVDGEIYKYKAYPMSVELQLKMLEAQENENQVLLLKTLIEYFDKCIEFERVGFKDPKEKVKAALNNTGELFNFINEALEKVGKQAQEKK